MLEINPKGTEILRLHLRNVILPFVVYKKNLKDTSTHKDKNNGLETHQVMN